jgi:hypothetical protein
MALGSNHISIRLIASKFTKKQNSLLFNLFIKLSLANLYFIKQQRRESSSSLRKSERPLSADALNLGSGSL